MQTRKGSTHATHARCHDAHSPRRAPSADASAWHRAIKPRLRLPPLLLSSMRSEQWAIRRRPLAGVVMLDGRQHAVLAVGNPRETGRNRDTSRSRTRASCCTRLVIGTEDELKKHAELMRKNSRDGARRAIHGHVETRCNPAARPGPSTGAGRFMYGCLVAGHSRRDEWSERSTRPDEASAISSTVLRGAWRLDLPDTFVIGRWLQHRRPRPTAAPTQSARVQAIPDRNDAWSEGEVRKVDAAAKKITLQAW